VGGAAAAASRTDDDMCAHDALIGLCRCHREVTGAGRAGELHMEWCRVTGVRGMGVPAGVTI
jgi:hypothetical protein